MISLTQCRADTVWGISPADLKRRLVEGDRQFLRELPIEEGNLSEAFTLGPEAPFYLSQLLLSANRERTAEQLLVLQWRQGESPWREEAAALLLGRYLEAERYEEAEKLAERLLRAVRGDESRQMLASEAQRHLLEALYWQKKDEKLLACLEDRRSSGEDWDEELDLFEAVCRQRLGRPGWQELFVELFYTRRTSDLHARAYAYLEQESQLSAFPPAVSSFFQGKNLLYLGRNEEALDLIEGVLPALELERLDTGILVRELGAAYFAVSRYDRGAEKLLELVVELSPQGRLAAIEMAGRLYRKSGDFARANDLLSEVIRETGLPRQRDRAAWFVLDMARTRSPGQLIGQIEKLAPQWHEARYFADILESEISGLVARRDWAGLSSLHTSLRGYGPSDTMARLAWVLGRAVSSGLAEAAESSLPPQALFLEARSRGEGYYRFLAETALLDLGFPMQWNMVRAEPNSGTLDTTGQGHGTSDERSADEGTSESTVALIRGYFDYGLFERGAELLRSHWRAVPAGLIVDCASALQRSQEYLLSLRLMNLYVRRKRGLVEREDLELLYPRAFGERITELSDSEEIHSAMFFALVREESYFDPQIVSRSGAVGLTQLMEETASDSARWLRLEEYDLRDPEQNLALGARHFSRLLVRLEDIPKALMAYNAGLSRLRSWERNFAGLPTDLLVEALPYPETRDYVRKILVSAVYYGGLYYDMSLEQTVLLFFPGLE
jgi:hypothetical protein